MASAGTCRFRTRCCFSPDTPRRMAPSFSTLWAPESTFRAYRGLMSNARSI